MTGSMELLGARRVRELLDAHGIVPRKALGQNFVIDPNTIRKVIEIADVPRGERVVEIGAGVGSLTLGLAQHGGRVVAVEKDARVAGALRDALDGVGNVDIVVGDALELDLASFGARRLVGNLPYNVAATLVVRALETAPDIGNLTVMTQREVGERLVASPGSKTYGLTSVLVAYFAEARVAARVARTAFYPVPNVDSVVVSMRRGRTREVPWGEFAPLARAAFAQRRKTLRRSLASWAGDRAGIALEAAGIDANRRAEELGVEEFVRIAAAMAG